MAEQDAAPEITAGTTDPAVTDDLAAFGDALRKSLLAIHQEHSRTPIKTPGPTGAFPSRVYGLPFIVVVDASRLRNDVLRRCTHRSRTTLITAANTGDYRLFAAQHVVDEVFEHAPRWCHEKGVELGAFLACWEQEYLPVIRVVDVSPSLLAMLNAGERGRVEEHRAEDADDVPSLTLAILLEGLYLSNDFPALRAVYGDRFAPAVHHRWVQLLQAGSDARQLAEFGHVGLTATNAIGAAASAGVKRLVTATSPWIIAPVVLAAAIALTHMSSQSRRKLLDGTWEAVGVLAETHALQQHLASSFTEATPVGPSWEALAAELPPARVLGRACLHTLSRHAASNVSAEQLARALPNLGVAQSATTIRALLRTNAAFCQVWRGYWQVGRPHRSIAELTLGSQHLNHAVGISEPVVSASQWPD